MDSQLRVRVQCPCRKCRALPSTVDDASDAGNALIDQQSWRRPALGRVVRVAKDNHTTMQQLQC